MVRREHYYVLGLMMVLSMVILAGCPKPAQTPATADAGALPPAPPDAPQAESAEAPPAEGADAGEASDAAPTEADAAGEAKPIEWFTSYEEGMKVAADEGWPVMIDLYADWCGPCKMLDEQTWPDPAVQKLADKFVCIKVNVDENEQVAKDYGATSIPLVVFLKSDGTKIDESVGFRGPTEMAKAMEAALAKK